MFSRSEEIAAFVPTYAAPVPINDTATKRIELIDASQLCGGVADRWSAIRAQSSLFVSPYFDIEFTKAAARVRDDVEIAMIIDESEQIQGFFPFQRVAPHRAEPVGGRLNDLHSIIGYPKNRHEVFKQILKAADLKSYAFHAGLKVDNDGEEHEFRELRSHFMDMRDGWDTYFAWARKNSVAIKRQGQKTRALEREIGPLRFEFDCSSGNVLERLIELKRQRYQRSKTFDILSVNWAADLIREISNVDVPGFKGLVSAMWAADELVAVHFGMLANDVLHYWFPVYDIRFQRYSPGTELLLSCARHASDHEVTKVDLGYGDDSYKFRFCNGRESVSFGRMTFSRLDFAIAKRRYQIRQRLKGIPFKPLAKKMLRGVFPGFGQWNFK